MLNAKKPKSKNTQLSLFTPASQLITTQKKELPPTPPKKHKKEDCLWGDAWFDLWLEEGNCLSFNNDIPLKMLGYLALGHQLKVVNKYICKSPDYFDTRIHFFWVQNSRTGKTRAVELFLNEILKETNLKMYLRGTCTAPAILGGTNLKRIPDLERFAKDILWFDEVLINVSSANSRGADTTELFDAFRMAMNVDGHIQKSLATLENDIDYRTQMTGLFLTTPSDAIKKLPVPAITGGFLGRCFSYFKDISKTERIDGVEKMILDGRYIDGKIAVDLAKTINSLPDPFIKSMKQFRKNLAEVITDQFYPNIPEGKFTDALAGNSPQRICKLATIRSSLYNEPAEEHLHEACKLELDILTTTLNFLNSNFGDVNELVEQLLERLPEDGWTRREIMQHMYVFRGKAQLLQRVLNVAKANEDITIRANGKTAKIFPSYVFFKDHDL